MKKIVIGIVILAMLALIGFSLLRARNQLPDEQHLLPYDNPTYGISFEYPSTYAVREAEVGDAQRGHYSITLMDSQTLANIPPNSDGPPAIVIDFYQNDLDRLGVENWIKNTSASNYKTSPDGIMDATSVAGIDAISYTWDGLYRGDETVLSRGTHIVAFTVMYNSKDDQIHKDFERMLLSVVFR